MDRASVSLFLRQVAEATIFFGGVAVLGAAMVGGYASQSMPWGPTLSAAAAGVSMYAAFAIARNFAAANGGFALFELENVARRRLLVIGLATAMPIFVAGINNDDGSISAAFDPPGYWEQELTKQTDRCHFYEQAVAEAADSFRVAGRKWELGIITVAEYTSEVEVVKQLVKGRDVCREEAKKRSRIAERNLTRIRAM